MQDEHIEESLRKLLPTKEEGKQVEKPAEAALRQRMCVLPHSVWQIVLQTWLFLCLDSVAYAIGLMMKCRMRKCPVGSCCHNFLGWW